METSKNNVFGWVEVPVANMDRAIRFYETVFDFKIERHHMGPLDMGWFPYFEDGLGSGGSLVYHKEYYKPSTDGVLVYFTSRAGDLDVELARVEKAGGKVLQTKTLIAENYGYMALIIDSEGNRIALHSSE
jgi:predicted enzyme related to lactoylglutathione lyase